MFYFSLERRGTFLTKNEKLIERSKDFVLLFLSNKLMIEQSNIDKVIKLMNITNLQSPAVIWNTFLI